MRNRRSLIVASILAVFLLFLIAASAAAAPKKKVVVTFADFSERTTALFVAQDRGFFAEQGLDAELVQIRSGPVSMSALATGETQFYGSGATGGTCSSWSTSRPRSPFPSLVSARMRPPRAFTSCMLARTFWYT